MQLSTQGMKSDVTSDMAKTFKDFIQPHLDRVSRSFALGIGQLDLSLKVPVGLSYLICRMLDTVEDAAWPTGTDQESAFEVFETFLKIKPTEAQVSSWARAFPLDLPEGERRLLGEASRVFQEFHALEPSDRAVILGPVLSMSRGMNHFMSHKRETGSLRLTSMVEVQTYCFFVAGLVGEVLTGLVRERVDGSFPGLTYLRGGHFGLFLQKVNILKDQKSDEAEGRHLVPDRVAVRQSLRLDAREAMNYLDSIPIEQKSYRIFCAWALLLGLASLPTIELSARSGRPAKLPRVEALWLAQKIESRISNPEAMRAMFDELASVAFSDLPPLRESPEKHSLGFVEKAIQLYEGRMPEADLMQLLSTF